MKQLSILLICISTNLCGQTPEWFETGATWNYNFNISGPIFTENYIATFEVSEQLNIGGQDCSKIDIAESGNPTIFQTPFPCLAAQPPYYMYESNDSIFYANELDTAFHLAYDFGAAQGDTWEFIVPVHIGDEFLGTDTYLVTVLSTSTVELGGVSLKEMELNYENISETMHSTWEYGDISVTEFLGASEVFMIPFPKAGYDWVCEGAFSTFLQCYISPNLVYTHPDFSSCTLGVDDIYRGTFQVYPNPADGAVTVDYSFVAARQNAVLNVFDYLGRKVYSELLGASVEGKLVVNTNEWPNGFYILEINQDGIQIEVNKFIVTH